MVLDGRPSRFWAGASALTMFYDFMGVVTLLVFVVAAVVGADRAWRFLSRKRELRASDLRGSGGHGPYSASPYSDAELADMHDNRADSPRVLRNSDLLAKMRANPPGAVVSVTKAELEAIRKATDVLNRDSAVFAEPIPHARDPFAAWDGKRFVPVVDAPRVPANPMFDWLPDRDIAVRWLEAHGWHGTEESEVVANPAQQGAASRGVPGTDCVARSPSEPMFRDAQKADSKWRGTGGARSDMPQEWVDRVTEAGLVATNPVDVRRQAAEAGIRFNSQTGRGERIRETGPEAKWVP